MAQQALREGCSPKDMHRLMLGVSFTNWCEARPSTAACTLSVHCTALHADRAAATQPGHSYTCL